MKKLKPIIFIIIISAVNLHRQNFAQLSLIKNPNDGMIEQSNTLKTEEIVAKCTDALGGIESIKKIKSLRIHAVYPDHGKLPMVLEIGLPNLSRNPKENLVFDGKKACFLNGFGNKKTPELVDSTEWKDFEVEIAFHFPAFLNYKPYWSGTETEEGKTAYILKVKLPLGAVITYYIDSKTFLPFKAATKLFIKEKEFNMYRDFTDYKDVNGFKYPFGFTYGSRTGQQKGFVKEVEINIPFTRETVKIPETLK